MPEAEKDLNNALLTNLLLLTITGLLILLAAENLEILTVLERLAEEKCHKHRKHHKHQGCESEPETGDQ